MGSLSGSPLGTEPATISRARRAAFVPLLAGLAVVVPVTTAPASGAPSTTTTSPPATGAPAGLLATPLLSPARIPITLQSLTAGQALRPALASAMSAKAIGAGAAAASCAEVAQDGVVLYQDHANLPVLPASNMKLVTATALLDKLGPNYTFTTALRALHPPVNGVLHGDLYFVGGGDPLLREPSYAASASAAGQAQSAVKSVFTNVTNLVGDLRALGIREVTGAVVGDDARYDSLTSVPGWPARYVEEGDVGALSALGIDDGFATAGPPVPARCPACRAVSGSAHRPVAVCWHRGRRRPLGGQAASRHGLDRQVGFAPAKPDPW